MFDLGHMWAAFMFGGFAGGGIGYAIGVLVYWPW